MKKVVVTVLIAVCSLLCIVLPVQADTLPAVPHSFYGDVYIDGDPAPVGTVVKAVADGIRYNAQNPVNVSVAGRYGGPDIADGKLVAQNLNSGAVIAFYVNDKPTGQTVVFTPGSIQELDLYLESGGSSGGGGGGGGGGGTNPTGTTQTTGGSAEQTSTTTPPVTGTSSGPATGTTTTSTTAPTGPAQTTSSTASTSAPGQIAGVDTTTTSLTRSAGGNDDGSTSNWYWIGGGVGIAAVILAGVVFLRHVRRY